MRGFPWWEWRNESRNLKPHGLVEIEVSCRWRTWHDERKAEQHRAVFLRREEIYLLRDLEFKWKMFPASSRKPSFRIISKNLTVVKEGQEESENIPFSYEVQRWFPVYSLPVHSWGSPTNAPMMNWRCLAANESCSLVPQWPWRSGEPLCPICGSWTQGSPAPGEDQQLLRCPGYGMIYLTITRIRCGQVLCSLRTITEWIWLQ